MRNSGNLPILLQSLTFNLAAAPPLPGGGFQSGVTLWVVPTCKVGGDLSRAPAVRYQQRSANSVET